jgi:hypothetical protein
MLNINSILESLAGHSVDGRGRFAEGQALKIATYVVEDGGLVTCWLSATILLAVGCHLRRGDHECTCPVPL